MSKEKLIELKNKLNSKYISYNGDDIFEEITQFEIEQKKNEMSAIINLENYFESLVTNLTLNGKIFDELIISATYKLFYKKEDIDDNMNIPILNAKPLKDFVIVSFGCYEGVNGDEVFHSDPEEIYKGCYDEFIVSFDEFKTVLEQKGFDVGTIKSFDEIESIVNKGKNKNKIPVTFFSIKFTKSKKLVKE